MEYDTLIQDSVEVEAVLNILLLKLVGIFNFVS